MKTANKILLNAFKQMVNDFNSGKAGINYIDLKNLQDYCEASGITKEDFKQIGV